MTGTPVNEVYHTEQFFLKDAWVGQNWGSDS